MILEYKGLTPKLDASVFISSSACVIGDVQVGEGSSLWFNVVVRGDVNFIRIGKRTNIQDGTVVHVTRDTHPTVLGDDITVGHNATLHGCTVHDRSLIGIGAIVLDGAVIGTSSLVAAGSVVAPGTQVPPHSLVMGSPARVKRLLTEDERCKMRSIADSYVQYQAEYRNPVKRID